MRQFRTLLLAVVLMGVAFAGCAEPGTEPGGNQTGDDNQTGDNGGEMPTYIVGTDCAFPPFEDMEGGECVGYDMDVIREVAARNNWSVEIRNVNFAVLIPQVQQGQIHMAISAMTITEARAQEVDFSIPYFVAENQAVTKRADDDREIQSLEDLSGLTIGVQAGTTGQFYVEDELGDDVELRPYDTYPLALQALRTGEIDVVVMDAPAQERAVTDDPSLEIAFLFEVFEEYGIAVELGSELLAPINDALDAMWDDGTIDELRDKWGV